MTGEVTINGRTVNVPKEFFDVGVKASFEEIGGEQVQPNITTEQFTFVLDAYTELKAWIADGLNGGPGIFEGVPFTISASDRGQSAALFQGVVDLQNNAIIQDNLKQIVARVRQDNGLNQLADLLEPLDFGLLWQQGVVKLSDLIDVDYVVNPTDNTLESVVTFITIYLLSKQLADTVKEVGTTAATTGGIAAALPGGPAGATIYGIAVAIIQIVYAAVLLALIIDFGRDLLDSLVQPQRTHKGILLKTLISRTCEKIGFTFETSITDLDNLVFLASNQNVDEFGPRSVLRRPGEIRRGIPNASDPGYSCTDLFGIVRDLFNARFAIVGETVQLHTESSDYWVREASYIKREAIQEQAQKPYRYNTDELKSSIFIRFQTDITDTYTVENYTGTAYQVLTDSKTVGVPKNKTIKNAEQVLIPWALGNRKDQLNTVENLLVPLAGLFDKLGGVFGRNPNLARRIKSKVGVLQVSDNNHAVPKLLWLDGGRIPSNQRDLFSARTLWEKYHSEKSFVENNFNRQRRVVEGETIPFTLADFVTLVNNSYFRTEAGQLGKITDIEWRFNSNRAIVNYWVQETYTNNLEETKIEPT